MITTKHRAKPYRRFRADLDIANQHRGRCQKSRGMHTRRAAVVGDELRHYSFERIAPNFFASMLPPVMTATVGPVTFTTFSTSAATLVAAAPSATMPS